MFTKNVNHILNVNPHKQVNLQKIHKIKMYTLNKKEWKTLEFRIL